MPALAILRADRALQHLLMANPDPEPPQDILADTRDWVARREAAGWFRVIDTGQGAAGFVQVSDIHRKNRFGWLGIAVAAALRGKGVGARALAAAEAAAREELGLRKLLLQVMETNAAAIALYDRAGWRRVGTLTAHYFDGTQTHDVLVMEKVLT